MQPPSPVVALLFLWLAGTLCYANDDDAVEFVRDASVRGSETFRFGAIDRCLALR